MGRWRPQYWCGVMYFLYLHLAWTTLSAVFTCLEFNSFEFSSVLVTWPIFSLQLTWRLITKNFSDIFSLKICTSELRSWGASYSQMHLISEKVRFLLFILQKRIAADRKYTDKRLVSDILFDNCPELLFLMEIYEHLWKLKKTLLSQTLNIAFNLFLCFRMSWQLLFWYRMPSMAQVWHRPC